MGGWPSPPFEIPTPNRRPGGAAAGDQHCSCVCNATRGPSAGPRPTHVSSMAPTTRHDRRNRPNSTAALSRGHRLTPMPGDVKLRSAVWIGAAACCGHKTTAPAWQKPQGGAGTPPDKLWGLIIRMCVCGSGCTSRTETDQGERMWSCERNWRMASPRASRHADLTPVHETGRPEHEMGQVRPLPSSDSVDAKEPRRAGRQEKRSEGGQHNTRQATGAAQVGVWDGKSAMEPVTSERLGQGAQHI